MIAPSKPPLEILTSNLSELRAEPSSVKWALVIAPPKPPLEIFTSTLFEFIASERLVKVAFETGTVIVSFKLTFKLSLDKLEGNPARCKALVAAPLGRAEEEIVTSVVSQLNSAIVCKVLSVAKSPIPLEIFTFTLLLDTQSSKDWVFVLTAFVEVKIASCREYILVR